MASRRGPVADLALTEGFIYRYLSAIDSPRSLMIWLLYKYKEHDQLTRVEARVDCISPKAPGVQPQPHRAVDDYLASMFLSKSDFLDTSFDVEMVALKKFRDCEIICRATNARMYQLDSDVQGTETTLDYARLISIARNKIAAVLGTFEPSEFIETVNWGPGATVQLNRTQRLAYDKFRLEGGMSQCCLDFWTPELWDSAFPRWKPKRNVQTAYLHTVAKNSKTNRCIIIEPGINTFLQKGLGGMIKRRLARIGIRIDKQAEYHRKLVPMMSIDGDDATVDFSSASDCGARELVRRLLPPDWFAVLDAHRSHVVELTDGSFLRLEKFSSMGNGFTFELETLIFWALARSVCERHENVSVYGDDVILPSSRLGSFRDLALFCGFNLNLSKSFAEGYFRESCGAHAMFGLDAEPLYLRSRIGGTLDIFKVANQLRRLGSRLHSNYACDIRFAKVWGYLTGATVARKFRIRFRKYYIPDGYGDFGLVVDFDTAAPFTRRRKAQRDMQRGFCTTMLLPRFSGVREVDDENLMLTRLFELTKRKEQTFNGFSDTIDALAMRGTLAYGNELVDLSSPIYLKDTEIDVPVWNNLGPWA